MIEIQNSPPTQRIFLHEKLHSKEDTSNTSISDVLKDTMKTYFF